MAINPNGDRFTPPSQASTEQVLGAASATDEPSRQIQDPAVRPKQRKPKQSEASKQVIRSSSPIETMTPLSKKEIASLQQQLDHIQADIHNILEMMNDNQIEPNLIVIGLFRFGNSNLISLINKLLIIRNEFPCIHYFLENQKIKGFGEVYFVADFRKNDAIQKIVDWCTDCHVQGQQSDANEFLGEMAHCLHRLKQMNINIPPKLLSSDKQQTTPHKKTSELNDLEAKYLMMLSNKDLTSSHQRLVTGKKVIKAKAKRDDVKIKYQEFQQYIQKLAATLTKKMKIIKNESPFLSFEIALCRLFLNNTNNLDIKQDDTFWDLLNYLIFISGLHSEVRELLEYKVMVLDLERTIQSLLHKNFADSLQQGLINRFSSEAAHENDLILQQILETTHNQLLKWLEMVAKFKLVPPQFTKKEIKVLKELERPTNKKTKHKKAAGTVKDDKASAFNIDIQPIPLQEKKGKTEEVSDIKDNVSGAEGGIPNDVLSDTGGPQSILLSEILGIAKQTSRLMLDELDLYAEANAGEESALAYMLKNKTMIPLSALIYIKDYLSKENNLNKCKLMMIDATAFSGTFKDAVSALQQVGSTGIKHPIVNEARLILNGQVLPRLNAESCLTEGFRLNLIGMDDSQVEACKFQFIALIELIANFITSAKQLIEHYADYEEPTSFFNISNVD